MSKNIFKKSCIILFHSSRLSKLGQENHIIKGLKDLCLSVKFNTALNATGTGIEWARWIFCEKHARFSAVSLCTLYLWGHMSSFRSQALWQISSCFLFFCCCWFFVFLNKNQIHLLELRDYYTFWNYKKVQCFQKYISTTQAAATDCHSHGAVVISHGGWKMF